MDSKERVVSEVRQYAITNCAFFANFLPEFTVQFPAVCRVAASYSKVAAKLLSKLGRIEDGDKSLLPSAELREQIDSRIAQELHDFLVSWCMQNVARCGPLVQYASVLCDVTMDAVAARAVGFTRRG